MRFFIEYGEDGQSEFEACPFNEPMQGYCAIDINEISLECDYSCEPPDECPLRGGVITVKMEGDID